MDISLIVATDKNLGIGKYNQLPWKLKTEMKFFRNKTESKILPIPILLLWVEILGNLFPNNSVL